MIKQIKRIFYFPFAYYFCFWAKIQLKKWHPTIVVITGSSGKTTLLHLVMSQLQQKARYSHHANSAFGIPFDILGLSRKTLTPEEWFLLFLKAPFSTFKPTPNERLYIVEADCDRPGEGRFLAKLLHPAVTLWTGVSRSHSANFDKEVQCKQFPAVEEAIAHEFGYFIEETSQTVIIPGDSAYVNHELSRTQAKIIKVMKKSFLKKYVLKKTTTTFYLKDQALTLPFLLPENICYSLSMLLSLLDLLGLQLDKTFSNFSLPPGRSSVFAGIRNATLIDSSYNATLEGMTAMLSLLQAYPAKKKWLVLGDMVELGKEEKEEHEKLATLLTKVDTEQVIFIGPRLAQYTYPLVKTLQPKRSMISYEQPKDALVYLQENLPEGTTVLFKGARFLEGILAYLLKDKKDQEKLARREKAWEKRRKDWEL